jgi:paraquat-inducible protein A
MRVLRALQAIRPWGMVEVFMLGVLVALVKLAHIATVEPGLALWSFGSLIVVFAAAAASFDADLAWAHLEARR